MKIHIAADMEGISGVVSWEHVGSSNPEYGRFRKLMTADVNAAIEGVFEGGADEVTISDGHGSGRNILIEELDERARLNSGSPSPFSMMQGVGDDVDGVLFIGYHARAGTPHAILDHTWIGATTGVWLNGTEVGEIGVNAAVAGHFDVPVIAISGCRSACAEAATLLGDLETAPVKVATSRMAAECLPPAVTRELILKAAIQAVERLKAGESIAPYKVERPVELGIEFNQSDLADRASMMPGASREGRRVFFKAADMLEAYWAFRALVRLA
ncbi:MAG: M55 family metallopeptidase [Gemmatimonadetes bacterium]|jgi:D-amino peptidase|nr:M55 family metallopeptidase [Gemmatimonadota bacterium]